MNELNGCHKCPFCGYHIWLSVQGSKAHWYVMCEECTSHGPMKNTREEAIKAWNIRKIKEGQLEEAFDKKLKQVKEALKYIGSDELDPKNKELVHEGARSYVRRKKNATNYL